MKDSIEQIVARYKADPSRENMKRIADDNGCTMKEIGEFLKDAATPRKPGRPKSPRSEATKKGTNKKASIKDDSNEGEMHSKKYLIPQIIESITKEKIAELSRLQEIHINKAKELELEIDELKDFLSGGFDYGHKE